MLSRCIWLSALLIVPSACTFAQHLPPANSLSPAGNTIYQVRAGDRLSIQLLFNADLNQEVVVRSDGRISLPLVSEVEAAGLTPGDLASYLEELFLPHLNNPKVTVALLQSAQRIFVYGEVAKPGEIPWIPPMTALDAIAQAGGFTDRARMNEVVLVRRDERGHSSATRLDADRARLDPGEDVALDPYDQLYVPMSAVASVNVWVRQHIREMLPIPVRAGF